MEWDWKTVCICLAIIIVLVFIIKKIFWSGRGDKMQQINNLIMDGMRCEKNLEYQTAIYHFKKVVALTQDKNILKDTYFAIAGCYFSLKRYKDSLAYCDKSMSISLENNLVTLNMRFHCHCKLGLTKEYLRDLVLYNSLLPSNVNGDKIEELYYTVSNEEARKYVDKTILPHSERRYELFFQTLIGILPSDEDDEVVYSIKHKKYQKLDDLFLKGDNSLSKSIEKSKKLFNRNLVYSMLCYLKGEYEKAIELLKDEQSDFEMLFSEYLRTIIRKDSGSKSVINDKRFLESFNPTFIYYIAKIYYYQKDYDRYIHFMCKILDYSFAYVDLLVFFDEKNDETKFADFSYEGLEKFNGDRQILYICAYHYYVTSRPDILSQVLERMDNNDPSKHFFTGLLRGEKGELVASLKRAIALDKTYHNAYLFLTNALLESNDPEFRQFSLESLHNASCYDEVVQAYKILLEIEIKDYVAEVKARSE